MAISIHLIYAEEGTPESNSLVEKIRPYIERVLGDKLASRILGENAERAALKAVPFPRIPELVINAKSTDVYNKKADAINLPPEEEEKYYAIYVKEVYQATRKEMVNENDFSKYINVLSQGGTREGIYHALVLDSTYAGLENMPGSAMTSSGADYTLFFYKKYFNKLMSKDSLRGISIYTMKRAMTEKALDLIDSYGEDREAIENWYAHVSVELASKFPQAMNNRIRKSNSLLFHKKWAGKVPVHHIKSELIIKIHSAMNNL